MRRLAQSQGEPKDEMTRRVLAAMISAPRRSKGEPTEEDWRRLLHTAADCCGAAGSYALLRPTDARLVLEPKLAELAQRDIGILVVNPDCYRYLASQLKRERSRIEVIHLAELMTQATSA